MREYLEGFFKEFEYDGGDVSELLAAYDATVGNVDAALLLKEAASAKKKAKSKFDLAFFNEINPFRDL